MAAHDDERFDRHRSEEGPQRPPMPPTWNDFRAARDAFLARVAPEAGVQTYVPSQWLEGRGR